MFPFTADVAHAMGGGGSAGADPSQQFLGLLPLVAMFAIFYFLLIRPQQKKAKEHKAMLEALKKGDEVVTAAGMMGRVTAIAEDVVTVEVAPDVKIKFQRNAIASVKKAGG
jgi:preprotein translocase subunit YajC